MKQLPMNWYGSDSVCYFVPVTAGLWAQMSWPLLSYGGRGTLGVVTERSTKDDWCGQPCPSGSVSGRSVRTCLR